MNKLKKAYQPEKQLCKGWAILMINSYLFLLVGP